jgi:hypothetical protein
MRALSIYLHKTKIAQFSNPLSKAADPRGISELGDKTLFIWPSGFEAVTLYCNVKVKPVKLFLRETYHIHKA